MSIIETFTKIISRGKTKTENVRTADYVIGDFPFSTPDAISAESAMRISTVYSCIRVRAESIAMLPLRLYEISKDGSRKPAYKNPLYKLLHDAPNSWQTAAEFLEIMSWSLDTFGNFYAYISRYGDEVVELIPIANYMVSADYKPNSNEPQYTVTVKVKGDTKNIVCGQREILHIKLTALDGLHGLSPIQQVNSLFYNADSTDKLAGKVYQNGIMTSGVLSTDAKLDKDTHKAIRDAFYKTYTGSENAGKPMILDNGLKYQQFKISLVDTQFIDNRKYDRDEICGVFRIPPHMVANLDHATFSNIEQQNIQFVNYSLVPYLRRIEQRLNKQLIPSDKQHKLKFKFDLTSLLRGDSTSQVNYVKSLLDSGVITINNALEMLGMNTCIGGDIRKLPLNTAYMDQEGKIINPNLEQPEESAENATENGDNI